MNQNLMKKIQLNLTQTTPISMKEQIAPKSTTRCNKQDTRQHLT